MKTKLFLALAVAVLLGANTGNAQSLTDTYWKNPKTGDWVIGFTEKHVIYDNAVWDIVEQTERKGGYTFTISNGSETKDIKVSPTKKEERTITIDKKVSVKCSPITTSTLPDYPTRDDRQGFKDNGYRMGDSVTIVGWLKDMPAEAWERGKEFEVAIMNILTDEQDSFYAPLDSLGRFAFKVPLFNTSQAFLDWKRSRICTVLEPNETYFLLVDFTTGQRLFMGTDARLQNELIAYPHGWLNERIPHDGATYEEAIAFMESVDSVHKALDSELEERIANHPKLSKRYIDYVKGYYIAGHGESLMQARFYIAAPTVPQEFMDYAAKHIWEKIHPYTLYRDYNSFLRNYIGQIDVKKMTAVDYLKIMADKNTITLTEEERYAVDNFDKVKSAMRAARTAEERQNIEDTYNVNKVMNTLNNLIPRMQKELNIEIICNHSISMSFQEPRLLPDRTALQNVNFVLGDKKATLGKPQELLYELGISDTSLYPDELSGGMKARVSIARALARKSDIYLFDEPFANLDKETAEMTAEVIKRHTKFALVIAVIHDIELAERIADRVIRFNDSPISGEISI